MTKQELKIPKNPAATCPLGCHPKISSMVTRPFSTKTSCCSLHPAEFGSNPQLVGEKMVQNPGVTCNCKV